MSLTDLLIARIAAQGPLTVADFMSEALLHPAYGYYTTHDPFGAQGDFTTAPEISQMFGELVGLSLAQSWLDQGRPSEFTLAELGPGRGTLMADILRATRQVPGFHDAARLVLVEASPMLRTVQLQALSAYSVTHINSVFELPNQPTWLVANEFFDALPIRQFQRTGKSWNEVCVGATDQTLAFGLAPATSVSGLDQRLDDTDEGQIVEICPTAPPIMSQIGQLTAQYGGAALVFDYGDWRSLGDTLQAVRDHSPVDPLACPGQADLTAHVDFEPLCAAIGPAAFSRVTPQGVFLERLGITARAQALAQRLTDHALETHIAAHRRLTHPAEMGTLFKVLGIFPDHAAPPPGLDR